MVLSLTYDENDDWRAASRQLYDLLIKPIEGELKPGSVLAVVPDGPLRGLPFSALPWLASLCLSRRPLICCGC